MKISICMGIYNGEKFIGKQLESILMQTCPANEVILCDDGSTDNTVAIVQKFIEDNRLDDTWYLYENGENKGYPANFYYTMSLCTGDVVFLADQDDIWVDTKLEKMVKVLQEHPEINIIACRYGLINGEGKEIRSFIKPSHGTGIRKMKAITLYDIFYRYEWPGMVLAYRNIWYQKWNKTISEIPHDIFICAKAAEEGSFFQLDEILAWQRRHENNTAREEHRIRKLLNKKRKLWEIEKYLKMLDTFERCEVFQTKEGGRIFREKLVTMRNRYEALQSGKITQVLKSAGENHGNVRLSTVICDTLIVKF